jgi:hypothetical protein
MAKSPSLASQETVETTTEFGKDKKPDEEIEMEIRDMVRDTQNRPDWKQRSGFPHEVLP